MKRTEFPIAIGIVFDTNVVISAMLLPQSKSRIALDKAFKKDSVVISDETFAELAEKILAVKFDKYLPLSERMLFLQWFKKSCEQVKVNERIVLCRDPKDDKFLSLAVSAKASAIITGDKDLLVLNPFKSISIITPAGFLKNF